MRDIFDNRKYQNLLDIIGETFLFARKRAFTAVYAELTIANKQEFNVFLTSGKH